MPQRRMNSLKSLAMNCGPLSEMIRGVTPGNFSRARWMICSMSASVIVTHFPVDEEAATAIQEAAQVVERAGNVEVRDIDVPVFVRPQGLDEALALGGGLGRVAVEQAGLLEDAVD